MFGPLTLNRLDNGLPYGDYHVTAGTAGQPLYNGQIGGVAGRYTSVLLVPQGLVRDRDLDSRTVSGVYPLAARTRRRRRLRRVQLRCRSRWPTRPRYRSQWCSCSGTPT